MLDLVFFPVPCLVVDLRQDHLFECILSLVLCTIDIYGANGGDNGDFVRQSSAGEKSRVSVQMLSHGSKELTWQVHN